MVPLIALSTEDRSSPSSHAATKAAEEETSRCMVAHVIFPEFPCNEFRHRDSAENPDLLGNFPSIH